MKDKKDIFAAWIPIDLGKNIEYTDAEYQQGEPRFNPERIKIMGIASTEAPDEAGEIIIQDGIDWTYFLKRGFLNLEHKQGPEFVMGQPEAVKACDYKGYKATMLKGYLYSNKPSVKSLVETMEAMKKAGADRKMGLSVEGSVIERDSKNPHIITKSKVLNVSVTSSPCNSDADMEIIKSLLAKIEEKEVTPEFSDKEMTSRQIDILEGYVEELRELFDALPSDADLPEWCQAKITRALDYVQAAYHYMDVEFKVEEKEDLEQGAYMQEFGKIKKEEDDHKIYDMLEMLVERYPELKRPDVMERLHEMMEIEKRRYSKEDNMTPDEFEAQVDREPPESYTPPDFQQLMDSKIDAAANDPKPKEGDDFSFSNMETIKPIVPQSLDDAVSYADYGMSEADRRAILEFVVRKYPNMEKDQHMAMYNELMHLFREKLRDAKPKHKK